MCRRDDIGILTYKNASACLCLVTTALLGILRGLLRVSCHVHGCLVNYLQL